MMTTGASTSSSPMLTVTSTRPRVAAMATPRIMPQRPPMAALWFLPLLMKKRIIGSSRGQGGRDGPQLQVPPAHPT